MKMKKKNFTQLDNEVLEELLPLRLSGTDLRIILFVARKTFGWQKDEEVISMGEIGKALGIHRTRATSVVKSLTMLNILTKIRRGHYQPNRISINRDTSTWNISRTNAETESSVKKSTTTSIQATTKTSIENGTHNRNKEIKKMENTIEKIRRKYSFLNKQRE